MAYPLTEKVTKSGGANQPAKQYFYYKTKGCKHKLLDSVFDFSPFCSYSTVKD